MLAVTWQLNVWLSSCCLLHEHGLMKAGADASVEVPKLHNIKLLSYTIDRRGLVTEAVHVIILHWICSKTVTGGMGKEAATFYKRLADLLASKRQNPYPAVMGWLRCRLSFASIRSAIMCIRGSRSSLHRPVYMDNINLVSQEGRIPPPEYIIPLWITYDIIICCSLFRIFHSIICPHKLSIKHMS